MTRSTPSIARAVATTRASALSGGVHQHVDHRRALRRAQRDLGVARARAGGRQHAPVRERAGEVDRALDVRVRVVGHDDHRVLVEERLDAAAGLHDAPQLGVGGRDRLDLRVRAVLVRVRVVVGQRQQQEVEEVVLDEVGADAAGVLVAHARDPHPRPAGRLLAGEDVGVEQLARAERRALVEQLRGGPREREVARDLVLVAAAVDEVGRARRAHRAGVVERLEDRRHVGRQVRRVHVEDRVDELVVEAELARRGERRAVLDVALLGARVPVHRGDLVLVLQPAGGDRARADGRHRRETPRTQSGT